MRLASIELRNYRCFEHLEVELDETTVIVGANDTGKSTLLEAINGLLDPSEIDWDALRRDPEAPTEIVGRFVDLLAEEASSLAPFLVEGALRIGLSSESAHDRWLVVTPDQARLISDLVDPKVKADALAAGSVPAGFEHGVASDGPNGPEVWYPWWIWEFGPWTTLEWWAGGGSEALDPIRPIRLGTSAQTAWDPLAVLEPILLRHLTGDLDPVLAEAMEVVEDRYFEVLTRISKAHSSVLARSSAYRWIRWHGVAVSTGIEGNLVGSLSTDADGPAEVRELDALPTHRERRAQTMLGLLRARTATLTDLGPGTQRSVALAALELYRDPDLWPLGGAAVLLVEEPEAGLHPAAQRDAAALLAGLATHGLQVVVVTHSPSFINAAPPPGIRLARKTIAKTGELERTIVQPTGLLEVRDALGIRPADVLLARRFAIVEGKSDRLILDAWARRLGVDLALAQVQLVPTDGYSNARRVSQFIALAYEGAEFVVILDEGAKAKDTKLEIEALGYDRVAVEVLSKTNIEGFFSPQPVTVWLRDRGADGAELDREVGHVLGEEKGGRVGALERLAKRYLARPYDKVGDGLAIASATLERDVPPEIVGLITRLTRE